MSVLALLDPTTFLLGGVLVLFLLWWLSTRRPAGLPPGPSFALPLLGHLHLLDKDPRAQFRAWRHQYGDVFSLYMGGRLVVVLNGFPVIKEALVKFADVFSDRPHIFIMDRLAKNKGIGSTSGRTWKEQRKTSLEILREFGMGKNLLAEKIQEEITHYIRAVEDLQGAPADLSKLTQVSVSNNICSIIFGQRFEYDDTGFCRYLNAMNENLKFLAGTAVVNFMPILEHIPGDLFKVKKMLSNLDLIEGYIDSQVEKHAKMWAEGEEESTNFIHAYLREIRKHEASGNADTTINVENLQKCIGDLFIAGTETTTTAIGWALLFFLHHPEVQDKCYKEICDVIGPDCTPSMHDRQEMTYMEATLLEVLRKGNIAPLSVSHGLSQDITFHGYSIPQDAIIIPHLSSILQDPEIWGDPENFRPERFIGPDGKRACPEEFIPFSTGRRVCLGESLARMELFLYLSTLVQHFRFLPPEEETLPSLEGEFGLTLSPKPYKIRAVPRT